MEGSSVILARQVFESDAWVKNRNFSLKPPEITLRDARVFCLDLNIATGVIFRDIAGEAFDFIHGGSSTEKCKSVGPDG